MDRRRMAALLVFALFRELEAHALGYCLDHRLVALIGVDPDVVLCKKCLQVGIRCIRSRKLLVSFRFRTAC